MSRIEELVNNISQWGVDRNITEAGGVNTQDQISKMIEELAECVSTLSQISKLGIRDLSEDKTADNVLFLELHQKLEDDLGDMVVCIIQASRIANTTLERCLERSWEDIKDRRGYMENGKFVKEVA